MTITDLQTSLSLSTPGDGINYTKTTLQTDTGVVALSIQFAPAAGNRNTGCGKLKVFLAVSPFSITAAQAPKMLAGAYHRVIEILPGQEAQTIIKRTRPSMNDGLYAYVWTDVPAYNSAPVLDIKLVEI